MSTLSKIIKAVKPGNASNVRVILLCIFAATTFWFFNALNENYSTTLKYPLKFVYDQDRYIAIDPLPDNIQINVSGLGWNLFRNSLGIKVTPLEIPLEDPAGVNKIVAATVPGLISDQLDEMQLNYVLTDTLFINIDSRESKKFFLAIDSANISLEKNYRITNHIRYTPDTVELEGPNSMISSMPDTILVSLPQEDIDEDYNEDVAINIPNSRLIRRNPPTVNVVFAVEEFISREATVPLQIENISEKAFIEQENIKAFYKVRASQSDNSYADQIVAVVDFKQMNPADSTISPWLKDYPSELADVRLDTARIKVHFNE